MVQAHLATSCVVAFIIALGFTALSYGITDTTYRAEVAALARGHNFDFFRSNSLLSTADQAGQMLRDRLAFRAKPLISRSARRAAAPIPLLVQRAMAADAPNTPGVEPEEWQHAERAMPDDTVKPDDIVPGNIVNGASGVQLTIHLPVWVHPAAQ